MKYPPTVLVIGIMEIIIGGITVTSNLAAKMLAINDKSPKVFTFVIVAGIVSILIGIGILNFKKLAYQLLMYFSSVIILSKLLIFMDVIHLNGALETVIPGPTKNILSVIYHGLVIAYFNKHDIKEKYQ